MTHQTSQQTYQSRFAPHLDAVQTFLEALLTLKEPDTLWAAMRHGVLNGGKRIRPVLLLETCMACGGDLNQALPTAAALELIHCFSLIHDDLPCIDNDDLRRGRPTVHKAFSEDIAVLAGDALLGMAFGLIPDHTQDIPPEVLLQVISELSHVSSVGGLVNGQVDDLIFSQAEPDETRLYRIHRGKTGALFRFSTRAGAILAGQPPSIQDQLGQFGESLGIAFQIVDDLLDIHASYEVLGKTPGKDQVQGKITFPAVFGIGGSKAILKSSIQQLYTILENLPPGIHTNNLQFLVHFIEERES